MSYLDFAATLVKRLEACKLVGYADTGGIPTDGYGHTGPEVRIGRPITQAQADQALLCDLIKADCRLESVCYPSVLGTLHDHQRAALVSFVFNVGAQPAWTIWKDLDDRKFDDVPVQLKRFDKGRVNGKLTVIRGLDNRRDAEIAFWNTADVEVAAKLARPQGPGSGVDLAPPSHTTVNMITPPTPEPAPPMAKVSLAAKAVTVIGGGFTWLASNAQQVHGVVSPYADNAKAFATLDSIAVGAIIAAGIAGILIHEYQAHERTV